ncbi:MAG: hypothetical protein WDA00_00370 [Eubacteriales bacterium]
MPLFRRKRRVPTHPEQVLALHGQTIRYVTERVDGEEMVIGRGGSLSVRGEELLVFSSADIVFRTPLKELQLGRLLSGDGVILTGAPTDRPEQVRTLIIYFVYHRK